MSKQVIKDFLSPTRRKIIIFSILMLGGLFTWFLQIAECKPLPDALNLALTFFYALFLWPVFLFLSFVPLYALNEKIGIFFKLCTVIFYCYLMLSFVIYLFTKKPSKKVKIFFVVWFFIIGLVFAFLKFFPTGSHSAKNTRMVEAIKQMQIIMTDIFTNEGNYDSLSCQHPQVRPICREIEKNLGKMNVAHSSASSSKEVCVYSPLYIYRLTGMRQCIGEWFYNKAKFSQPAIWYCVDSTGVIGQTNIDPGSTGYCVDGESAKCPPVF